MNEIIEKIYQVIIYG